MIPRTATADDDVFHLVAEACGVSVPALRRMFGFARSFGLTEEQVRKALVRAAARNGCLVKFVDDLEKKTWSVAILTVGEAS